MGNEHGLLKMASTTRVQIVDEAVRVSFCAQVEKYTNPSFRSPQNRSMVELLNGLGYFALFRQPIYEKENLNSKPGGMWSVTQPIGT